jgi:dihydroorotase
VGEAADIRLLSISEAVRAANEHRDRIVGFKVRVGQSGGGSSGIVPLQLAIQAADASGLPVMSHIDIAPPTYSEVLEHLRPGDIITHAFRPPTNGPIDGAGRVLPAVHAARERGILFDIAHGKTAFDFNAARAMLDAGCPPDIISSDVSAMSIDGPVFNVLVVMSKFLALGMSLPEVIRAATSNPARAIRRNDLGTLKPGSAGDAAVLEIREGDYRYRDSLGAMIHANRALHVTGMVVGGKWWDASQPVDQI